MSNTKNILDGTIIFFVTFIIIIVLLSIGYCTFKYIETQREYQRNNRLIP